MRLAFLCSLSTAISLLGACSAANPTLSGAPVDAGEPPKEPDSDAECDDGDSQPCDCDDDKGKQACYEGEWGACYCAPPPREVSTDGDCLPGTYTGDFSGLAGTPVPFVPVTGLSLAGGPPLVIHLSRSDAQEFALVGDGTLSGSANGLFEFEATISGTLDCNTKKFTGKLEGSAKDVFGVFIHQVFTGNMLADYDAQGHELVNGKWDLMSRDVNATDGGTSLAPSDVTGNGDWSGKMGLDKDGGP